MIQITIDNSDFIVKPNISILEACKSVGVYIPRFCYHEILSVSGNCRMCLVELDESEKPIASCVTSVRSGMIIKTNTPFVKKARENVVETLLLNHPLDCPICDQGGECDLQDQTKHFGNNSSKFFFNKRSVKDKECGPLIKTIMTRCIHCTRCVRFSSEIAGTDFLGTFNRGSLTEIGSYVSKFFNSEISTNVIDLCPVGALTSKTYAFKARPWELRILESIDLTDSICSNIYLNLKGSEIVRVLPKPNKQINGLLLSDKARYSFDFTNYLRIQNIFAKNITNNGSDDNYERLSIALFYKKFKSIESKKIKPTIYITEELGFENLKSLSHEYSSTCEIYSLSSFKNKYSNLFISNKYDKIKDIDTCEDNIFLLGSNPKIDATLINTKIRVQQNKNLFNVYSFSSYHENNIGIFQYSLNLSFLSLFLVGKSILSSLLMQYKNMFIITEQLSSRYIRSGYITENIKKINASLKLLEIKKHGSSVSSTLLNIKYLNSNKVLKSQFNIGISLVDSFFVRKYFQFKDRVSIWINSHGSEISKNCDLILPSLTIYEEDDYFINLEERPQKSISILPKSNNVFSVKNWISSIVFLQQEKNKNSIDIFFSDFLAEIIKKGLFNTIKRLYNDIINEKIKTVLFLIRSEKTKLLRYLLKTNLDYFLNSYSNLRYSRVLLQCSEDINLNGLNFIFCQ